MFNLSHEILKSLCSINHFPINEGEMTFWGLRGLLPIDENNHEFATEQLVQLSEIDYIHPRCSILQWLPDEKKLSIFPGSTVPHRKYVQRSLEKNGEGANRLMTGFYNDYRKGIHKAGSNTGHDAFRQINRLPIRRTGDDLDYDEEDRVEFGRPYDNIHAGWCPGINGDSYASAGCQVVVGYPKCKKRNNLANTGPWKVFQNNAYGVEQTSFTYILLNGRDAQKISLGSTLDLTRLRYGSNGEEVKKIQQALKDRNFYEGNIDDDFGSRTLFAVLDFQTSVFGTGGDDGIVGPMTAEALEISLT